MTDTKNNKILGTLCAKGHDHNGTGKSLRYKCGYRACVECTTINARRNRAANLERYEEVESRYRAENRELLRERSKIYRAKNVEKMKARSKKYYHNNKEKIAERMVLWFKQNKDAIYRQQSKYLKKQRENNAPSSIAAKLRNLVYCALRWHTTTGKTVTSSKYGIDYKAIIDHLGPHPNTLGVEGDFHIDHIIPVSAFNLNDLEQVKIAFAPSNHRWLPAHENRLKNASLPSADIVPVELLAMLENHNIGVLANG